MPESHEHESIQFDLPKQLKAKVRSIFYDKDASTLNVYIADTEKQNEPLVSKVDTSSMRTTLGRFEKNVDGTLNPSTKLLCVYSIKYHLRKYVKFDTNEQQWYSENYSDDPSLQQQSNNDSKKDDEKTKPKKIAINKYSGNGRLPLHESVIIGEVPVFVTIPNGNSDIFVKPKFSLA